MLLLISFLAYFWVHFKFYKNRHNAPRAVWIIENICASCGLSTKQEFGVHRVDYWEIFKISEKGQNYNPQDAQRNMWIIVWHCFLTGDSNERLGVDSGDKDFHGKTKIKQRWKEYFWKDDNEPIGFASIIFHSSDIFI